MPKLLTTALHIFVAAVGAIVIGALALAAAGIAQAAPPSQSDSLEVRIQRVTMISDFEDNIKTTFGRGARIRTEVELRDLRDPDAIASNAPDYRAEYILSSSVNSLRLGTVYQGRNDPASLKSAVLTPGEEGIFEIYWNVPYDFGGGEYNLRVEVSKADSPHAVEHHLQRDFRVSERSEYVHISKNRYDFGNINDEETPRSDIIFIAPINGQAGDLIWRVTEWPSEWLNLVDPLPDPDDPTQSVEVVNNGSIVLQVEETTLFGNFQNEDVVVSTNAGDYTIKVSGNIDRHPGGKISDFGMRPPRRFDAGDIVKFRYRIDNSGRTNLLYRVTFIVTSPTNTVIYDSSVAAEDALIEVDDGENSGIQEFEWQIPHDSIDGIYRVGIQLRNAYDFGSAVYSSIDYTDPDAVTFSVLEGPLLEVSPTEVQFGTILDHSAEQARATFSVTNVGRLTLEWRVTSVPDWAELVSPLEPVTGDGEITLRIKEDAATGSFLSTMTIESNGGNASVTLGVNIPRHTAAATRTPVPTATPAPTDTPQPTATPAPPNTPLPTETPVPEPTDTPVPTETPAPTSTPAPTATNTPPPTGTPQPTATLAPTDTPAPTATPTPQPTNTPQPTATPEPTSTPEPPTTAQAQPDNTPAPPPPTAIQPGVSDTPPGGACSGSPQPVSPLTGMANIALLLLPVALAGGARLRRRQMQ
ncbi:MAG: hypothetical protein OXG80_01125 [Chloroflexi bacterium]|nr:hypothetical protein [Chloroflexota bacterium]